MVAVIDIADRKVGEGQPCLIIAEAGVNHNGDVGLASKLIDVAAECGADVVKFQTFKADRLASHEAPKAEYQVETTGADESQLDMLRRLELPAEAHAELQSHCKKSGILFMSSPFDEDSADLLDELGVPAFKIASSELTNLPFLESVARKGRPIMLSTGMSRIGEVDAAVRVIRGSGNDDLILLHCVSNYPADPADANLRAMQTMALAFQTPVGYSDHTAGIEVPIAAVALGASVLEKHFTLDRGLPGPDHRASLEPAELAAMVRSVRSVESALGHGRKEPAPSEAATARIGRRSLVAARDIPTGTRLTPDQISILRPGTGLRPDMLPSIVGRTLRVDVAAGTVLSLDMLS